MNNNKSNLDSYEMLNRAFDQDQDATRVVLVGGEHISIKADLPEIKFPDYQTIEIPVIIKEAQEIRIPEIIRETKIEYIEKPIYLKEYETIEKLVYVPKVEYVEKQVVIEVPKIVHIEKIKSVFPNWVYGLYVLQTVCFIVMAIKHFIK